MMPVDRARRQTCQLSIVDGQLGPLALAILASPPLLGGHAQGAMADSAAVKRSSTAIALTSDGAMLLVVNPDSNSLTLVDTADRSVIAEIPVGVDPRTVAVDSAGARAYVANRWSDSVSVIDLAMRDAIAEVQTDDRPYGVVVNPAGIASASPNRAASRTRTKTRRMRSRVWTRMSSISRPCSWSKR